MLEETVFYFISLPQLSGSQNFLKENTKHPAKFSCNFGQHVTAEAKKRDVIIKGTEVVKINNFLSQMQHRGQKLHFQKWTYNDSST